LPQPATPRAVDPLEAARDALYALNTAANHAEPRISRNSKKWRVVIGVAAGLILAAALAMFFLERRGEAKPAPSLHTANAVEVPPIVVAAPKPAIHHALIHVLHPISVSLAIDNGKPSKSSFEQNDTPQFDFAKSATLRVSDGAAIEIRIDGNTEGPLLSGPQVLHLTPNGVELVK
jgi:hypothetical protein